MGRKNADLRSDRNSEHSHGQAQYFAEMRDEIKQDKRSRQDEVRLQREKRKAEQQLKRQTVTLPAATFIDAGGPASSLMMNPVSTSRLFVHLAPTASSTLLTEDDSRHVSPTHRI